MNTQTFLILLMLLITAGISVRLIARVLGMKLGEDTPFLATMFYIILLFSIFYGLVWAARYVKWL